MFRILNNHSGDSRLEFQWNRESKHLKVVMGDREEPLNTWDFYDVKQGSKQMTGIFRRPDRPSCQFSVFEVDDSGKETQVQAPQWVAFDGENRVRILKREAVREDLRGTQVILNAERNLQEDCIYYMIQGEEPFKYPVPVPGCSNFSFFVDNVEPRQLRIFAAEERPNIMIQSH